MKLISENPLVVEYITNGLTIHSVLNPFTDQYIINCIVHNNLKPGDEIPSDKLSKEHIEMVEQKLSDYRKRGGVIGNINTLKTMTGDIRKSTKELLSEINPDMPNTKLRDDLIKFLVWSKKNANKANYHYLGNEKLVDLYLTRLNEGLINE